MTAHVLIVDDDPVQRRLLQAMAQRFGYIPLLAEDGDGALAILLAPEGPRVDAVILDLVMPNLDGMGVMAKLREAGIAVPVIVQTAHGGLDAVVSAMRAGAADFVVKPVGPERLQVSLANALATHALKDEVTRIKRAQNGTLQFRDIITRSPSMQTVLHTAEKAAASSIPVLIEGESGVGKELFARAIHGSGERRTKPFVPVNCGALPENLIESILFGHEKGSFTGATEKHIGKFAEASGGTLFLDEVGELPPAAQVKLLRAIQEGEIEPVGGRKPVKVDVRIISATHRNLLDEVRQGRFREDLFYRLHVFPLTVPPLRARPDDIPDLARHFLARFAAEEGRTIRGIAVEALALLQHVRWPGNVRQLENALFRAVVMADGDIIGVDAFPQLQAATLQSPLAPASDAHLTPFEVPGHIVPLVANGLMPETAVASTDILMQSSAAIGDSRHVIPLMNDEAHVRPLADVEADAIRHAVKYYRGQMSEVARRLRIGRSTLYRKLDENKILPETETPNVATE